MTLYTIIPEDQVLAGINDSAAATPTQEIEVNGMTMEVEPINGYQAKIVRLHSPNPQDYLNPRHAPGQLIHFSPTVLS
jgi:myo-inositol-hexaphosphate 3-phosphohydrolase